MLDDIDAFNQLINPNVIVEPQHVGNKSIIELIEENEPNCSVIITSIPENSIVFRFDNAFPEPRCIFSGTHEEYSRADYIIIVNDNNQKHIILVELKKNRDSQNKIISQLKGAASFIYYCYGILKYFFDDADFQPEQYEFHFVAFKHIKGWKYHGKPQQCTPTEYLPLMINSRKATYRYLISKPLNQ